MYRAPSTSINTCNDNLASKIVYVCGDYTIDLLHCLERYESKYFFDQMFSSALYPFITRPTRMLL